MVTGPRPKAANYSGARERFMDAAPYQVIINALHQRGPLQDIALEVLDARGLWLTDEQKITAGLASPIRRKNHALQSGAQRRPER